MDFCDRFQQYEQWFSKPHAKYLEQEITEYLQHIDLSDWKGRFLQIGDLGDNTWSQSLKFASQYVILPLEKQGVDLIANPCEIPLASHSFDVIFAPFIFELGIDPKTFIEEADRVLSSMGLMVIVGLNPCGLWRLSRFFKFSKKAWYQSKQGSSAWAIRKLFQHLHYEVFEMGFFYFIPPVKQPKILRYFTWVNRISKFLAFYPPSVYLLVVQKRDIAMNGFLAVEKSTLC